MYLVFFASGETKKNIGDKKWEKNMYIGKMGCILIRHGAKDDWYQNPKTKASLLLIIGVFLMRSCQNRENTKLTRTQCDQIKAEVKQAAIDHLNAKDAATALSHFTENVIAVSNVKVFPTFEALAEDVKVYYDILKEVNLAVWDEMTINVINIDAALVTARFRYRFTGTNNEKTDLQGVWTALYIRQNGDWKIEVRHESFVSI